MDKTKQAYEYLRNEIVSGRLPPQTPIVELEVAASLGMSRSPVREALRALERDGLLVSYPARGSFVAALTPYDVEEIFELRILLESWALERSLARIPAAELDRAEAAFSAASAERDWEKLHQADRFLHGLIVDEALCKRLGEFVNTLNAQIERIRYVSEKQSGRAELSYREHMDLIAALRARDLPKSKRLLREHLRSVEQSTLAVVRTEQAPPQRGLL